MGRCLTLAALAALAAGLSPAAEKSAPEKPPAPAPSQAADPGPFMGEYVGTFAPAEGEKAAAEAKVFPVKGGEYRVVLRVPPVSEGPTKVRIELSGKPAGAELPFAGKAGKVAWSGRIAEKKLTAAADGAGGGKFEMTFAVRRSPTEGARPPDGAVVLLPQTEGPPPLEAWTNRKWKALPGGVMEITRGGSNSIRKFGDVKLHLEFRVPLEPGRGGQGRGNSGVYLMGRYEVQVLDSFGLKPRKGDCGAIYGVAVPRVNACLPPLRWQTYDVTFRAPRVNAEGKLIEPGRMTVDHNGIRVHTDVKLTKTTRAGARGLVQVGPLHLQDHGHPVQYRNIWIVEPTEAKPAP